MNRYLNSSNTKRIYGVLARSASMFSTLIATPILLSSFGVERFAIFSLLLSYASILTIFDFGLNSSIVLYLKLELSKKDFSTANEVLSNILSLLLISTLLLNFLILVPGRSLVIKLLFGETTESTIDYNQLLIITTLSITTFTVATFVVKLLIALDKSHSASILNSIGIIIPNFLLVGMSKTNIPFPIMMGIFFLIPFLSSIVFYFKIRRNFSFLKFRLSNISITKMFHTLFLASPYFFLQTSNIIAYHLDIVILSKYLTDRDLASFSVSIKILFALTSLYVWYVASLTPKFISLLAFTETRSVLYLLRVESLKLVKLGLVILIVLPTIMPIFIKAWSRGVLSISTFFAFLCALWLINYCVIELLSRFLHSRPIYLTLLPVTILSSLVNLLLTIHFASSFRSIFSTVLASICVQIVMQIPIMYLLTKRTLRISPKN